MKHCHTAISVFAGCFDPQPKLDVLTSFLTGIGPNKDIEAKKELYKAKKRKKVSKQHSAFFRHFN